MPQFDIFCELIKSNPLYSIILNILFQRHTIIKISQGLINRYLIVRTRKLIRMRFRFFEIQMYIFQNRTHEFSATLSLQMKMTSKHKKNENEYNEAIIDFFK
ncbi:Hypothetical_protein [Hexamita inflata]|uniref:Hypothetical_protein n=1 Tax=Hexamita inflata TaxID=28002 RepID=A0ABP1JI69_9EUKA